MQNFWLPQQNLVGKIKKYNNKSLCFDDILLVPQTSSVESRHLVDLSTSIGYNNSRIDLDFPIIGSPMDTVCDVDMCVALDKVGGIGILHRYMPVKTIVEKQCKQKCPYTTKDIQSLMNNACGFYCLAMAHFICSSKYRTNDLYRDIDDFMDMFDDLNHSIDWKKNEYILKHFFLSEDPNKRKPVDVLSQDHSFYDKILDEDEKGGVDLMKLPVDVKYNK